MRRYENMRERNRTRPMPAVAIAMPRINVERGMGRSDCTATTTTITVRTPRFDVSTCRASAMLACSHTWPYAPVRTLAPMWRTTNNGR